MKKIRCVVVSFLLLLSVWQGIVLVRDFPASLVPSPLQVGKAMIVSFTKEQILFDIVASMKRFAIGYVGASILAILFGLLLGNLPKIFDYVNPILQVLRPISPMAWLPFIVLWFGIGEVSAIVIISIAAFFPVLFSTIAAVGRIPENYIKTAKNLEMKKSQMLYKIIFPACFPQIANSLHVALGSAWIFLVAGEMSGSQIGLGYRIMEARNNIQSDRLLAVMILIGGLGFLLDEGMKWWEKRLYRMWGEYKE